MAACITVECFISFSCWRKPSEIVVSSCLFSPVDGGEAKRSKQTEHDSAATGRSQHSTAQSFGRFGQCDQNIRRRENTAPRQGRKPKSLLNTFEFDF